RLHIPGRQRELILCLQRHHLPSSQLSNPPSVTSASLLPLPPLQAHSAVADPPRHCATRKITNSAGRAGATPTTTMSLPVSKSADVIVVSSQRTKYASSGVRPISAPSFHNRCRNS